MVQRGRKELQIFSKSRKRHCKQGTISQLKINDTDFVTTDRDILSECTAFYKNLYTSKSPDSIQSTFLSEVNSTSLTNEEQTLCEGPVTQKECFEALSLTKRQARMDFPPNSTKFFGKTFLFF